MKSSHRLRFLSADQVEAGGMKLQRLPLATEGEKEPLGELQGVLIDPTTRRVPYLVVEAANTGRKCIVPLDATCVDRSSRALERVSSDDLDFCESFDASAVESYDDDALMSLMFERPAA